MCAHCKPTSIVIIIFIKYKKVELFHACKQLDLKLYKSTGDKINRFDWKKQTLEGFPSQLSPLKRGQHLLETE